MFSIEDRVAHVFDHSRGSPPEFPAILYEIVVEQHLDRVADAERFATEKEHGTAAATGAAARRYSAFRRVIMILRMHLVQTCSLCDRAVTRDAPLVIMDNI